MEAKIWLSTSEFQSFSDAAAQTAALVWRRTFGMWISLVKGARRIPQLCLFSPPSALSLSASLGDVLQPAGCY